MSAWLDISYVRQISGRVEKFKEKQYSPYLANSRCPICGDSEKKSRKARGYFYQKKDMVLYKCFNCGASMSFGRFLKDFDRNLYDRYALERYREKSTLIRHVEQEVTPPATKKHIPDITSPLDAISDMDESHPAVQYVVNRKIPEKHWCSIFYVEKFFGWASGHTNKFELFKDFTDHARLIFPWYDKDGILFAYHARTMGDEEPKYYSIVIDDTVKEKVFGLDRLNEDDRIYVVEGPIDSLYIDNAVAVGTSALYKFMRNSSYSVTYIPDRDCRNKEIMAIVKKMISMGLSVCMMPESDKKDIGEMIESGMSREDVMTIIDDNTFHGLSAELHFLKWRKIDDRDICRSKVQQRNESSNR